MKIVRGKGVYISELTFIRGGKIDFKVACILKKNKWKENKKIIKVTIYGVGNKIIWGVGVEMSQ